MLPREYSHEELGQKLRELRPPGAGKDGKEWFSLEELQGRIAKLAKLEKDGRFGGTFGDLRGSLLNIQQGNDKKSIKSSNLTCPSAACFSFFAYSVFASHGTELVLYCS